MAKYRRFKGKRYERMCRVTPLKAKALKRTWRKHGYSVRTVKAPNRTKVVYRRKK